MTKVSLAMPLRLGLPALVALLLNACAPLSQEELDRMARETPSVRPLAESLARADDGRTLSLDDDRFLAEISGRTLSRKQFLGVLSDHCRSAHAGSLEASSGTFPLADSDIRDFQLEAMLGARGPVVDYLREALGRTLNSDIARATANLTHDAGERYGEQLHRQGAVVCTSYGDNGLLQIHYLVAYLTPDDAGGSDVVWAVASEGAFREELADQRQLAVAAANRRMSQDRETVVRYRGEGSNGALTVTADLSRPAPYGYDFELQLELQNAGAVPLAVTPTLEYARTADGRDWETGYGGVVRGAGNTCESITGRQIRVEPGSSCRYRVRITIDGFEMPNMVLTGKAADAFVKLSPVSEFESRVGR